MSKLGRKSTQPFNFLLEYKKSKVISQIHEQYTGEKISTLELVEEKLRDYEQIHNNSEAQWGEKEVLTTNPSGQSK